MFIDKISKYTTFSSHNFHQVVMFCSMEMKEKSCIRLSGWWKSKLDYYVGSGG